MCTCPFVLFSDNPSTLVDHQCSWSHASSNFTSCNRTSSLFRYLHFNATSAENPLSQAHVMRNVGGLFTRLSDISGFWEWARRGVSRSLCVQISSEELSQESFITLSFHFDVRSDSTAWSTLAQRLLFKPFLSSESEKSRKIPLGGVANVH